MMLREPLGWSQIMMASEKCVFHPLGKPACLVLLARKTTYLSSMGIIHLVKIRRITRPCSTHLPKTGRRSSFPEIFLFCIVSQLFWIPIPIISTLTIFENNPSLLERVRRVIISSRRRPSGRRVMRLLRRIYPFLQFTASLLLIQVSLHRIMFLWSI